MTYLKHRIYSDYSRFESVVKIFISFKINQKTLRLVKPLTNNSFSAHKLNWLNLIFFLNLKYFFKYFNFKSKTTEIKR